MINHKLNHYQHSNIKHHSRINHHNNINHNNLSHATSPCYSSYSTFL